MGDKWHMDEVVLTISGVKHWLWRAIDQTGTVLGVVACVDGPLGARGVLHDLTSGAMAVMCPACDAAR